MMTPARVLVAMVAIAVLPSTLSAQAGRIRPELPPGEPPTAFVFFNEGLALQLQAEDGDLRVSGARDLPGADGPTPIIVGDRLVSFASQAVGSVGALESLLDGLQDGDAVELMVDRGGETIATTLHVTTIQRLLAAGRLRVGLGDSEASEATAGGTGWNAASEPPALAIEIAGNRIQADESGNLVVVFKSRHAAATAVGLRLGDRIVTIGGHQARDAGTVSAILGAMNVGEEVEVQVEREGELITLRFPKPADS